MNIAVIIPFYQEEEGILTRAIRSVFLQCRETLGTISIFVVDDASPVSARKELELLDLPDGLSIQLIEQENGGPGAARNTALNEISKLKQIDYVAFLDSDDEWQSEHLADAAFALNSGYDFYFCDTQRTDFFDSYFDTISSLRNNGAAIREKATPISDSGASYGFSGHSLTTEFIEEYLCHTSTIVVRASLVRDIRFAEELRYCSEDWLFWITLADAGARIAISWKKNGVSGEGLNIYFSAFDWDSPKSANRIFGLYVFSIFLSRMFRSGPERACKAKLARFRRAASFIFTRCLLRRIPMKWSVVRTIVRNDPVIIPLFPYYLLSAIFDRGEDARNW